MGYYTSATTFFIFLLIAFFPDDALNLANYLYLQIRITTLDAYMFAASYLMYRRLRKDGMNFPFKYVSIRDRK